MVPWDMSCPRGVAKYSLLSMNSGNSISAGVDRTDPLLGASRNRYDGCAVQPRSSQKSPDFPAVLICTAFPYDGDCTDVKLTKLDTHYWRYVLQFINSACPRESQGIRAPPCRSLSVDLLYGSSRAATMRRHSFASNCVGRNARSD